MMLELRERSFYRKKSDLLREKKKKAILRNKYKVLKEKDATEEKKIATKLFGYSILYLFMIFTFILLM